MTTIVWDTGTAYDLFISLIVLHNAAEFGLRPSWAAGVRQRLSAPRREFLEQLVSFAGTGLEWVCGLNPPKDAADALRAAADLEPAARFEALALPAGIPAEARAALHAIAARGAATAEERECLRTRYLRRGQPLPPAALENLVNAWRAPAVSGEYLLEALREYYRAFFAEEEARLRPALEAGLARAREMAERLEVDALVEALSHGVRIADLDAVRALVLAPSFWASPLVFHLRPKPGQALLVFGVRLPVQSVAPGAEAPDLLVTALKSLADPTRLRILRFLSGEPLPPAELARRLRLRPPTVIHHLQALRLAGLVKVVVNERNERRYAARLEALDEWNAALRDFLSKQEEHV